VIILIFIHLLSVYLIDMGAISVLLCLYPRKMSGTWLGNSDICRLNNKSYMLGVCFSVYLTEETLN
jgi:hypothetical protein